MKALVAFEDEELGDLVAFFLESRFQISCDVVYTPEAAVSEFRSKPEAYDLYLCDYLSNSKKLILGGLALEINRPFLCTSELPPNDSVFEMGKQWIHILSPQDLIDSIDIKITQIFRDLTPDPTLGNSGHSRIQPRLLLSANPLQADIYVKLSQKKFVRIMEAGFDFDRDDFDHFYLKKRFDYLYIKQEDALIFSKKLHENVLKKLSPIVVPDSAVPADSRVEGVVEIQKLEVPDRMRLIQSLESDLVGQLDAIHQVTDRLGFTQQVQRVTRQCVMDTFQMIQKMPKLSMLLLQFSIHKERYISQHQMGWNSDGTGQKLVFAAFLHDISLKNQDLAKVQTLVEIELRKAEFTIQELADFKDHPTVCAGIARIFKEIPADVDSLIAQHHERPDGSGFPRGISHLRIGALSALFIMCHDLVDTLLKKNSSTLEVSEIAISEFVLSRATIYDRGSFKRILNFIYQLKL